MSLGFKTSKRKKYLELIIKQDANRSKRFNRTQTGTCTSVTDTCGTGKQALFRNVLLIKTNNLVVSELR